MPDHAGEVSRHLTQQLRLTDSRYPILSEQTRMPSASANELSVRQIAIPQRALVTGSSTIVSIRARRPTIRTRAPGGGLGPRTDARRGLARQLRHFVADFV